jgi:hypothetical protein
MAGFDFGSLYAKWTLDTLIELAYAVSSDFINRPQLFTGNDIPPEIVDLRMSYGAHRGYPNTQQRAAMLMPIFGRSDGLKPTDASNSVAPFILARRKFFEACIAYSERAVDTGLSMLEERVQSSIIPFRAFFESIDGQSVSLSARQIGDIMDVVTKILRSSGVAKVYGASAIDSEDSDWPWVGEDHTINSSGAKLVEAASNVLPVPQDSKMSYIKFILLQRVAQEGSRALSKVGAVHAKEKEAIRELINHGYIWATSLRDFQQTV